MMPVDDCLASTPSSAGEWLEEWAAVEGDAMIGRRFPLSLGLARVLISDGQLAIPWGHGR